MRKLILKDLFDRQKFKLRVKALKDSVSNILQLHYLIKDRSGCHDLCYGMEWIPVGGVNGDCRCGIHLIFKHLDRVTHLLGGLR